MDIDPAGTDAVTPFKVHLSTLTVSQVVSVASRESRSRVLEFSIQVLSDLPPDVLAMFHSRFSRGLNPGLRGQIRDQGNTLVQNSTLFKSLFQEEEKNQNKIINSWGRFVGKAFKHNSTYIPDEKFLFWCFKVKTYKGVSR